MSAAAVAAATAANQNAVYEAQMLAAAAMQSAASHVHLSDNGAAFMAPGYGVLGSGCYPQQQQYSLPTSVASQTQNAAAAQAAAAFALAAFMKNNNNGANKMPIIQQHQQQQQFMTPEIEQMIYQQQLQQQQQQQNHLYHPQLIIDNNNGLGYSTTTTNMSYHIGTQHHHSLVKNNNNNLLALQQQQQNTAVTFQNKQQQLQPSSVFAVPGLPLNPTSPSPSTTATAFEGSPIFLVPQSGILSLNALQRANEFKLAQYAAAAASAAGSHSVTALPIPPKVDTSKHFHIFVGDLSTDVDNETLKNVFENKCGLVSEAKVMRDPQSMKSRGYGFVAFPKKESAQKALDLMTGEVIGKRPIRVNWAQRRTSTSGGTSSCGITTGATIITTDGNASSASVSATNYASDDEKLSSSDKPSDVNSSDAKAANNSDECGTTDDGVTAAAIRLLMEATDAENTTVYLGNFQFVNKDGSSHEQILLGAGNQQIRDAFERQVRNAFKRFGEIKEVRLYAGSGNVKAAIPFTPSNVVSAQQQHYGFVIFERKECAAYAIHAMNGQPLMDAVADDDGCTTDSTLQRILVRSTSLKCSWGRSGTSSSTPSLQSENGYPSMAAQLAAAAATTQHAVTANQTIATAAHNANLMAQMMSAAKWRALPPPPGGMAMTADIIAQQQQLQAIGLHQQSFLPQNHVPIMAPSSSTGFYYDPQLAAAAAAAASATTTMNRMPPYH